VRLRKVALDKLGTYRLEAKPNAKGRITLLAIAKACSSDSREGASSERSIAPDSSNPKDKVVS